MTLFNLIRIYNIISRILHYAIEIFGHEIIYIVVFCLSITVKDHLTDKDYVRYFRQSNSLE